MIKCNAEFSKKMCNSQFAKIVRYNAPFLQNNTKLEFGQFCEILGKKLSTIVQNFLRKCRIVQNWNLDNGAASTCAIP